MHIIFGKDQADKFKDKYVVLELDTVRYGQDGPPITAYCVVERLGIEDLPKVESLRDLHENLMQNYRRRDWNYCLQAIEYLIGNWSSELDSFYIILQERIKQFQDQDPGEQWDPVLTKSIS